MNTNYINKFQRVGDVIGRGSDYKAHQLQGGHSYLIKHESGSNICEIYVLQASNKCYQIKWVKSDRVDWTLKSDFENTHSIIEDLGNKQLADIKSNMYRK